MWDEGTFIAVFAIFAVAITAVVILKSRRSVGPRRPSQGADSGTVFPFWMGSSSSDAGGHHPHDGSSGHDSGGFDGGGSDGGGGDGGGGGGGDGGGGGGGD